MDLLEYIVSHEKAPDGSAWDYDALSTNRKITPKLIEQYPQIPWKFEGLVMNPLMPLSYLQKIRLNDRRLVTHRQTTIVELQASGEDLRWLPENPYLDPDDIWHHYSEGTEWLRSFRHWPLSRNKHLTLKFVLAHLNLRWEWSVLSRRLPITIQDLLNHRVLPWDWFWLPRNKHLSVEDILAHPELPWPKAMLTQNLGVTEAQILAHPNIEWNWRRQTKNPNLSLEFLTSGWAGRCDDDNLSSNFGLTLSRVLAHPEIQWNWYFLVCHLGDPLYLPTI